MSFIDLTMLDSMTLESLLEKMDMNNYEEICQIGTGEIYITNKFILDNLHFYCIGTE